MRQSEAAAAPRNRSGERPARNLGALPAHLPRHEVVIDARTHGVPMLRRHHARDRRIAAPSNSTSCPRNCVSWSHAVRAMPAAPVKAPWWWPEAPERPIDGGMATEALISMFWSASICDALPLYRQSQMLARQGIALDRATLCNWVGRACWWLTPLYELLVSTVLSHPKFSPTIQVAGARSRPRPHQNRAAVVLCGR